MAFLTCQGLQIGGCPSQLSHEHGRIARLMGGALAGSYGAAPEVNISQTSLALCLRLLALHFILLYQGHVYQGQGSQVWSQRTACGSQLSLSPMWGLGIKRGLSGLVASAFACFEPSVWATLLALCLCLVFHQTILKLSTQRA